MTTGVLVRFLPWSVASLSSLLIPLQMRAALTCSVYKRALILSNKARASFSNGKLMNHLSTDISRIDYCAMW
jgi:hypothetical protein